MSQLPPSPISRLIGFVMKPVEPDPAIFRVWLPLVEISPIPTLTHQKRGRTDQGLRRSTDTAEKVLVQASHPTH